MLLINFLACNVYSTSQASAIKMADWSFPHWEMCKVSHLIVESYRSLSGQPQRIGELIRFSLKTLLTL